MSRFGKLTRPVLSGYSETVVMDENRALSETMPFERVIGMLGKTLRHSSRALTSINRRLFSVSLLCWAHVPAEGRLACRAGTVAGHADVPLAASTRVSGFAPVKARMRDDNFSAAVIDVLLPARDHGQARVRQAVEEALELA